MPLNPNMKAIETITVDSSGGQSSIIFNNIPQTYTDLAIAFSVRGTLNTGSGVTYLQFNNDTTSANYVYRRLLGSGSVANSASGDDYIIDVVQGDNATAYTFGSEYIYISNYAGSTYKSVSNDFVGENNGTLTYAGLMAFLWKSTLPINSIKLSGNGLLKQYSTATLYGITSAGYGATKATGGVISQTATHWIHSFYATGTFTPTQNLTADYLVVAGGGGGAGSAGVWALGGGGGAGGLRSSVSPSGGGNTTPTGETALSLTSGTNYTISVGGGSSGTTGYNSQPINGTSSSISGTGITTISPTGGGGGKAFNVAGAAPSGGSGGGQTNGNSATAGGSGTTNQGFDGGKGTTYDYNGNEAATGGGGGAGGVGADGSGTAGGAGGAGVANSINGSSVYYAGGGGGAGKNTGGTGGSGVGGAGGGNANGSGTTNGSNGAMNTGGGAGGAVTGTSGFGTGGNGGSGIVIIRYLK